MWKSLVILVNNFYAQIDIYKQIKEKRGQDVFNVVRKYERLLPKFMKLKADTKFIKICKRDI